MTTKTTLASFLALTILGLGISQMAFAEEAITLDPTSNEGASCLAKMQEDTQQKHESSKLHIQKAIAAARSSDSLITEVKNNQYKYEAVTQGWNMDPVTCTVGLIETGVHFRATDSEGKTREIVVKIDPKTDRPVDVKVIHDKDRPTHAGTISTTNFAGHAIRGAASEASSQVYQAYMSYLVPTPNDPAGFDCGTTNSTACWISIWTGLTTNDDTAYPMVQTGTDSVCKGTNCATSRAYYQWFEIVNASNVSTPLSCVTDLLVSAGDSMSSQVTNDKKTGGSNASYDLFLINITDNLQCTLLDKAGNFGDPKYGLYVAERVKVSSTITKLASFTDITNVYGTIYYGGTNNGIYVPWNLGWNNEYLMLNPTTNIDATSVASNSKFTFDYITSAGTN